MNLIASIKPEAIYDNRTRKQSYLWQKEEKNITLSWQADADWQVESLRHDQSTSTIDKVMTAYSEMHQLIIEASVRKNNCAMNR